MALNTHSRFPDVKCPDCGTILQEVMTTRTRRAGAEQATRWICPTAVGNAYRDPYDSKKRQIVPADDVHAIGGLPTKVRFWRPEDLKEQIDRTTKISQADYWKLLHYGPIPGVRYRPNGSRVVDAGEVAKALQTVDGLGLQAHRDG